MSGSFWRFGFASQSSIDTLLSALPLEADDGLDDGEQAAAPTLTLEQLLEEDDLLQEVKTQHAKLISFLARPPVIRRMLSYVDGTAFDQEPPIVDTSADNLADRDRKRRKYPYLCSEILSTDIWTIMDVIFKATDAYLEPFWDAMLDRDPATTAASNFQLAFWVKVNGAWLGSRTSEMLAFLYARPSVVERILLHIASPSLADLLFRLVQCEEAPAGRGIIDWLADQQLVPRLVVLLAPDKPPDTHVVVADFLKAVIAFCSNANAAAASAELAAHPSASSSYPGWASDSQEAAAAANGSTDGPKWASNRLLRDLASSEMVGVLMGYMLDGESPSQSPAFATVPLHESTPEPKPVNGIDDPDDAPTPRPPLQSLPSGSPERGADAASGDSAISSLAHSASILIDLIRKNNSDFTEQQILNVLRKQAREDDLALTSFPRLKQARTGPSVVQLDAMLFAISARMADFQQLLKRPRSAVEPLDTSLGPVVPLTVERFRVCELYAELLHCSNMSLLNRTGGTGPMYDSNGYIVGGTDAIDRLAAALAPAEPDTSFDPDISPTALPVPPSAFTSSYNSPNPTSERGQTEDVLEALGDLALDSPSQKAVNGGFGTSPRQHESGSSSPSMDSESGHLTRDEVRALRAIVEGSGDFSNGNSAASSPPQQHSPREDTMASLPAGQLLKYSFLNHHVIETVVDFFFEFPWNNFLHNVVYDLLQQILNARLDRPLNRRLCHVAFLEAKLPSRILEGHQRNLDFETERKMRAGYMGHLTLIADEVVKFASHHPIDVRNSLTPAFPQPEWDRYVSTTLRETRDRDMQPLGGGVAQPVLEAHAASLASFSEDEDDEFPMSGQGGKVTKELHDGVPTSEEIAGHGKLGEGGVSTGAATEAPASDQFARYLVQQISGELPDKFSGSSSDEEDAAEVVGWVGDSTFDPKDVDFELGETEREPPTFGFDDRWDSLDRKALGMSDGEDGFGDFVDSRPNAPPVASTSRAAANPFASDTFTPTGPPKGPLTPADWTADWSNDGAFDRDPFGDDEAVDLSDDDDEFGAFESSEAGGGNKSQQPTSLTAKRLSPDLAAAAGDFDFTEFRRSGHDRDRSR